jgi:hypothetical protein
VNTETIKSIGAREFGVGPGAEIIRVTLGRELAIHANIVVRVISSYVSLLSDRVKSVDHVVPNSMRASVLGGRLGTLHEVRLGVISLNHGQLVLRNTKSSPEEALLRDNQITDKLREKSGADLSSPDLSLLIQSLRLKELLHSLLQTKDPGNPTEDTDSVARTSGIVKTVTTAVLEDMDVLEPVLECAARKMRREFGDEQLTEVRMLSVSKDLPEILIWEGSVRSSLEFEQVVLGGVQVDSMNTGRALKEV